MNVLKIEGLDSYWALQSFNKLFLGLKMLPAYLTESYEEFFSKIDDLPEDDKLKMIREAVMFVPLDADEIMALAKFCTDKNGIRYTRENMKSLSPDVINEIIVSVCTEIAKIKVTYVTETEKKN